MGGWSVAAMLALIGAIVVLGLYAIDVDGFEGGPLADKVSFDLAREMAHWHHLLFNVALGLIALHLVAIAFYLLVKRENLVGAMITGAKPNPEGAGALRFAPFWRLAVGFILSFGIMWFVSKGLKF
jgi:cytochrome b